eukprot:7247819-Prymnesium_polylepis.1
MKREMAGEVIPVMPSCGRFATIGILDDDAHQTDESMDDGMSFPGPLSGIRSCASSSRQIRCPEVQFSHKRITEHNDDEEDPFEEHMRFVLKERAAAADEHAVEVAAAAAVLDETAAHQAVAVAHLQDKAALQSAHNEMGRVVTDAKQRSAEQEEERVSLQVSSLAWEAERGRSEFASGSCLSFKGSQRSLAALRQQHQAERTAYREEVDFEAAMREKKNAS